MKRRLILVTILTLIAGWLRFTAITFGMPGTYRPDEEYMINPALSFGTSWNPHFSIYPSLQMYVQHAALDVYAHLRGHQGNFRQYYEGDNYPTAHVVARWVSAAMGTVTIPAIYFAALPFGSHAALAAAAIMTLEPIHVLNSKFATTDAAVAFWLTLAIAMLPRIVKRGRFIEYVLAGIFSGLAIGTKYPAGAVVFGVVAAHFGARRRKEKSLRTALADPRIYLAGGLTLIVFFCATPYFLLDWAQTSRDYVFQREFVLHGYSVAGYGWRWLLLRVMPTCFGPAMETLILVSLMWALFNRSAGALSLLAFISATFIALITSRQLFYRYIMVPLPALVMLAGVFVADLIDRAGQLKPRYGRGIVIAGFVLLLVPSLVRDIQLDSILLRPDTRTLAREWIFKNIPPGSTIAEVDAGTVYGKPQLPGHYKVVPFEDPRVLRSKHVDWVLSDSYEPLSHYSPGPTDPQEELLGSHATLVFDSYPIIPDAPEPIFDPNDAFYVPLRHISGVERPGPGIRIWRVNWNVTGTHNASRRGGQP